MQFLNARFRTSSCKRPQWPALALTSTSFSFSSSICWSSASAWSLSASFLLSSSAFIRSRASLRAISYSFSYRFFSSPSVASCYMGPNEHRSASFTASKNPTPASMPQATGPGSLVRVCTRAVQWCPSAAVPRTRVCPAGLLRCGNCWSNTSLRGEERLSTMPGTAEAQECRRSFPFHSQQDTFQNKPEVKIWR